MEMGAADVANSLIERRLPMVGTLFILIGLILVGVGTGFIPNFFGQPLASNAAIYMGGALVGFGGLFWLGIVPRKLGLGKISAELEPVILGLQSIAHVDKKELSEEEIATGRAKAAEFDLPIKDVPPFQALAESDLANVGLKLGTEPTVPMYTLDKNYYILDWNLALSLAFDRSMEGLRGQLITEWIFYVKDYPKVLAHAEEKFADPNNLPRIDVEEISFVSQRYGEFSATKRAYQIPDDEGECVGWLVVLDLDMPSDDTYRGFYTDLMPLLRQDLLISEYSISYDRVLLASRVYKELVSEMLNGADGTRRIPPGTAVLDLGAGTGNLTQALADPAYGRHVAAVDNNRMMLSQLELKCRDQIVSTIRSPGVTVYKQDVVALGGFPDEIFDYVIMNNVLYLLIEEDMAVKCLEEARRVLKPGGEIRISGPKSTETNVDVLFKRIRKDMEEDGTFDSLRTDYERAYQINKGPLQQFLYSFSLDDVKAMLTKAGFSEITYENSEAYAGQAMVIFATR